MKRKQLLTLVLCVLSIFTFVIIANADNAICEHTYDKWTISLGSEGFLGDITASAKCTVCNTSTTEVIPKIFITLGYSSSSDGVVQSYGVNRTALKRYEELSKEKIKFGAVVALRDTIGDQNPLDANGNPVSQYVKSYDYTDKEFVVIDVAIKKIPDSAKLSTKMMLALYINAGGRTTYIDNCVEKINCGAKSYNEIDEGPEAEATEIEKTEIIDGKRYHQITAEEFGLTQGKYWNGKAIYGPDNTGKKFWTNGTAMTREDLPNGTIIYVESEEWQYRPNKYDSKGSSKRPDTTKEKYTVIDDSWWDDLDGDGQYDRVGFNISYYKSSTANNTTNGLADISNYTAEQIFEIFKIFVPVTYTDENIGGGDNEGGNTGTEGGNTGTEGGNTGTEGGNTGTEGGNTGSGNEDEDDVTTPDYSAVKQNWADDGELKILAIGNSFSDDAMEYVYQIAKDAGIEKITLGKFYVAGGTLATHLSNIKNNIRELYNTNTSGTWTARDNKNIKDTIKGEDWDFITFQQASGYSGIADTYDDLVELINIIEPLNPSARLVWHMTWAYKVGSGHQDFPKYNKDQMTMYNAIVDAVNTKILTNNKIEIVIPSGTAVQNVRTSFVGDTTRDGYHLSYGIGRYFAAMTFVKALTGLSIDNPITVPSDVDEYELKAIIECVNNAINNPYQITTSSYPTRESAEASYYSANAGIIPEGYAQLSATEMGSTKYAYYSKSCRKYY